LADQTNGRSAISGAIRVEKGVGRMSIEDFENQLLSCRSKAAKEAWVRAQDASATAGKISPRHVDRLHQLLKNNDRHEALSLALAMAVAHGGNAVIEVLRRRGALRASRYAFSIGSVRELVHLLGGLEDTLGIESQWLEYLVSIDALYKLAPGAKRLRDGLMTRLSKRRGKALKSFLVLANRAFASGGVQAPDPDARQRGISAEDVASAVSRMLALTRDEIGLHAADFTLTDEQALNPLNGTYSEDLLSALRLEELYRAETLVDGLPYRARQVGDHIVVSSIDPDLEKSVRLGYVQTEMQVNLRHYEMQKLWDEHPPSPLSLREVFKRYYDGSIERFAEIKSNPLRRITIGIPNIPGLFDPLASEQLYREDILFLVQLSVEDYEEFGIDAFDVAPGIKSIDLFKVNRLFALMAYLYERELEKVSDEKDRERLALNSVVATMRPEQLLALLGTVLPPEKATRILDMLTLHDQRDPVDLQYSPFLKADDCYLVAPALVSRSNLVRNIAFLNGLNAKRIQGDDPMQSAVAQALRDAGFHVGVEVKASASSATGDTDVLAYRDGVLYLIECKNAYHPCNAHEMRNSYDLIVKAGEQLTLRQQKFGEKEFREQVWKTLGWDMPPPTAVRTAVLIANRVFSGTTIEGHPVRQAHEFINVVVRGETRRIGVQGEVREAELVYKFWDGDELTTADLDRYLSQSGLIGDHFASLTSSNYGCDFGTYKLVFESWSFDMLKHDDLIQKRYRIEGVPGNGAQQKLS
jgi:hypothetical protein